MNPLFPLHQNHRIKPEFLEYLIAYLTEQDAPILEQPTVDNGLGSTAFMKAKARFTTQDIALELSLEIGLEIYFPPDAVIKWESLLTKEYVIIGVTKEKYKIYQKYYLNDFLEQYPIDKDFKYLLHQLFWKISQSAHPLPGSFQISEGLRVNDLMETACSLH